VSDEGTYGERFGEDYQKRILAVAMRHPGFLLAHRGVMDHTFFTSNVLKVSAKALLAYVDKTRQLPSPDTLVEVARPEVNEATAKQVEKSIKSMAEMEIDDARGVMDLAIEFGKTQALVNAVIDSGDFIDKGTTEKILPRVQDALRVGTDITDIGRFYRRDVRGRRPWYLDPAAMHERIPTGLEHIDGAMSGGLARGHLGVILAPPKRGKTTTLINIGFGALTNTDGLNVVHYSMEMDKEEVAERYDDRLMGKHVNIKTMDPHQYVDLLESRVNKFIFGELITQRYREGQPDANMIANHLDILIQDGFRPDLVIVDYAALMKRPPTVGRDDLVLDEIYRSLRALASEYNVAMWTGAQATTGAFEKETLTMADFRDSRGIAAIVDAAWALCQTDEEMIQQRARLFAMAMRHSEMGVTVECNVNRKLCRIKTDGLFDPAYNPVKVKAEHRETAPKVKTSTSKAADNLKEGAGIKQTKRPPAKRKQKIGVKPKPTRKKKTKPTTKVPNDG